MSLDTLAPSPAKAGVQSRSDGDEASRLSARITMRPSMVRESMSEANSIFTGDKLLTKGHAGGGADAVLMTKLGLRAMTGAKPMRAVGE